MKKVVLLILFPLIVFSQTIIDEKFDNFLPNSASIHDSLKGYWYFSQSYRGSNVYNDMSLFGNNLTVSGTPTFTANSVLVNGENAMYLPSTAYLYVQSDDFGLTSKDATIIAIVRPDTFYTPVIKYYSTTSNPYWWVTIRSDKTLGSFYQDNTPSTGGIGAGSVDVYTDRKVHKIAVRYSETTLTGLGYVDNVLSNSSSISSGAIFLSTTKTYIGGGSLGRNAFFGQLELIIFVSDVLPDKKLKEIGFLASGWYSKNGGVTRNNWSWEQGIVADTVYTAIPNYTIPANRHAILSFDAYGASGGETLQAWLTGWDGHFSQTVSAKKTRYEIDLGELSFFSDSLYFAVPNAGQTVYIDNVKIEYRPIRKGWSKWR